MGLPTIGPRATMRVRTLSDWHVGTGTGAPGGVNATVRRDADGLPCVPGTTLTGVYREACTQVALGLDNGSPGVWTSWVRYLFGHRLSDGDGVEPARAVLRVRSARVSPALRSALIPVAEATTFVKPAVAVDAESGRAVNHQLRFTEMARAGVVLHSPLEWEQAPTEEQRAAATVLLVLGARWLRALGGDRRRGSGAVEVSIVGDGCPDWAEWAELCAQWAADHEPVAPPRGTVTGTAALAFADALPQADSWLSVPLKFVTVDPVRCPRTTLGNVVHGYDHLPGTTVLAWLLRTLDNPEVLRRAMATGTAVVTRAVPVVDGVPAAPFPLALGRAKHDGGPLTNRLRASGAGLRPERGAWIRPDGEEALLTTSPTELVTHNVVTEGTGRPTTEDGGVFTVEVIPAGRELHGELRLAASVASELDTVLGRSWTRRLAGETRLGAASKSEYGRVRVEVGDPTAVAEPAPSGPEITVWALSDVLVRDSRLRLSGAVDDVVAAVAAKLDVSLELVEVVGRANRTESWHGGWRLPRASLTGLAAGSCLLLRVVGGSVDPRRLRDLQAGGVGERRGEGFGQVLVDAPVLAAPSVALHTAGGDNDPAGDVPVEDGLDDADAAFLAAVRRAAIRMRLQDEVKALAPGMRAELDRVLTEASRSQRGTVRRVVTALATPEGGDRLDEFLTRRAKGKLAKLVALLRKLRDENSTDAPLRAELARIVAEVGMTGITAQAWLDAFGMFVLDVLSDIDARRTPRALPTSAPRRPGPSQEPDVKALPTAGSRTFSGRVPASRPAAPRAAYRTVHTRWELTATLVTTTPLHVGGVHGDPYLDLAIARDGHGLPYVPGTSLAGALRQWWRRRDTARDTAVWNGLARRDRDTDDKALASLITVADAPLSDRDGHPPFSTIRDGVGIDRRTGAAAYRIKYEREVVPPGTRLQLRLVAEDVEPVGPNGTSPLAAELEALSEDLRDHGLVLGAATTRGLGRLTVADAVTLTSDTVTTRDGMLSALGRTPVPIAAPTRPRGTDRPRPGVLRFTIDWRAATAVVVGANLEGERATLMPLVDAHPETGGPVPVVPGATVKGILRSEVERWLRTFFGVKATGDFTTSLRGLADRCPPFEALFGSQDRRSALSIPDIHADLPKGVLTWDAWHDYAAGRNVTGPPVPGWHEVTHVAVDRWTGGAAEGMLYTALEPHGVTWRPLVLDVDLSRLDDPRPSLTLLLYALTGLATGSVAMGHGGNRGLGTVEIRRIDLATGDAQHPLPEHWANHSVPIRDLSTARSQILALARELWDGQAAGWTTTLEVRS